MYPCVTRAFVPSRDGKGSLLMRSLGMPELKSTAGHYAIFVRRIEVRLEAGVTGLEFMKGRSATMWKR